jgi:hypothetical protein
MVIEIIGLVISAVGVATDIASAVERYNSGDAGGMTEMESSIFGKILKKLSIIDEKMNTVILQLQAANVGIEDVHFDIYNNTLWVREKDLHDAKVILNSRLVEFAALDGVDPACRIDQIKDFFSQ